VTIETPSQIIESEGKIFVKEVVKSQYKQDPSSKVAVESKL